MPNPTAAEKATCQKLRDAGLSLRDIASATGFAASTVARNTVGPRPTASSPGRGVTESASILDDVGDPGPVDGTIGFREFGRDKAVATADTVTPVRTLAEAVAAAEVDTRVWLVDRWECLTQTRRGTTTYKVKLALKRILGRGVAEAVEAVFAKFKDAAPRWPKVEKDKPTNVEPFMAVACLFDIHFGKLSWAPETGENYDLKIADTTFRNAVEDLLSENQHRRVTKIVLPLGQDFFHVDNRYNQTTRGTPQDVDGRFSKMLAVGSAAAVWAVEQMAAVAPVEVVATPGNHDRTLSECLCHIVAARFHHTDRVTVDVGPKTRKYVRFGTNLIGLAHGDLVKPHELPNVMAVDAPKDWAETTTREYLIGHGHRSMKWTSKDTDTHRGVVVRQLRALTRTDLWHFDNGFHGQQPGAEIYFYGRDRGYAGHAVVPIRA